MLDNTYPRYGIYGVGVWLRLHSTSAFSSRHAKIGVPPHVPRQPRTFDALPPTAYARLWLASLALAAAVAHAQSPAALPSAPRTQLASLQQLAAKDSNPLMLSSLALDGQHSSVERPPGASTPAPPATQEEPIVTVAPYHSNGRYWLSGQANIIFQGNLPLHSPYEGEHSLQSGTEYKTSLLGTLYTAFRPTRSIRYNTDLILDMESSGGRGLSQALGLAGFTNLDVVRNPNLSLQPYLARYGIHQVIGFTQKTTSQEPGSFALAPSVPLRRLEFRAGKMTLPDFFDVNGPGSDSHLQFMNWTVDNNGAWDYAADTRGYTVGGMAEYDDEDWSLRYGLFAMPTVANGIDMDWAFSRAHGQNGEFELRHSFVRQAQRHAARMLFYANRAHMGSYREAVDAFLAGIDKTPNIMLPRALQRAQVRLRLQHRAGDHGESARLWPLRLERGPARVLRLHRGGPDGRGRRRLRRNAAGIARRTRSAWPWSRTPSSATTRTI